MTLFQKASPLTATMLTVHYSTASKHHTEPFYEQPVKNILVLNEK